MAKEIIPFKQHLMQNFLEFLMIFLKNSFYLKNYEFIILSNYLSDWVEVQNSTLRPRC